jgi:hypothetical protein
VVEEPIDAGAAADAAPEAALPVPTIELDPQHMYMIGYVGDLKSEAHQRVICDALDLSRCMGALPDRAVEGVISVEGVLVYTVRDEAARELTPDPMVVDGTRVQPAVAPELNDVTTNKTTCSTRAGIHLVDDPTKCPSCDHQMYNGDQVWGLDVEGTVLCTETVANGDDVYPIVGIDHVQNLVFAATRAKPTGGFWVLLVNDGVFSRWSIARDGTATLDGAYPTTIVTGWSTRGPLVFDGEGNLYVMGSTAIADPTPRAVARLAADFKTSHVIYDGAKKPAFQLEPLVSGNPKIQQVLLIGN